MPRFLSSQTLVKLEVFGVCKTTGVIRYRIVASNFPGLFPDNRIKDMLALFRKEMLGSKMVVRKKRIGKQLHFPMCQRSVENTHIVRFLFPTILGHDRIDGITKHAKFFSVAVQHRNKLVVMPIAAGGTFWSVRVMGNPLS